MPGKHSVDTNYISFCIKRSLIYRINRYAKENRRSRTSVVEEILQREMDRLGIELSSEDAEKIKLEAAELRKTRSWTWAKVDGRKKGVKTK